MSAVYNILCNIRNDVDFFYHFRPNPQLFMGDAMSHALPRLQLLSESRPTVISFPLLLFPAAFPRNLFPCIDICRFVDFVVDFVFQEVCNFVQQNVSSDMSEFCNTGKLTSFVFEGEKDCLK